MASALAPIGAPSLGGVNQVMIDLCLSLKSLGYQITIFCPRNSARIFQDADYYELNGDFQPLAQKDKNKGTKDLIRNIWACWEKNKEGFDFTINLSYDLLPLQKTISSNEIILNYISMCHEYDDFTNLLKLCLKSKPWSCGFTNQYQYDTFGIKDIEPIIVAAPVMLAHDAIFSELRRDLIWIGRIAPEKGLQYAFSIAKKVNRRLLIAGHVQDEDYWQSLKNGIKEQDYLLLGQLDKKELYQKIQSVEALIITPLWNEAFGLTLLEALANKTPVIGFDSPGPRWIIQQTGGGFLVKPRDVIAASLAFEKIKELDMRATQAYVNNHFNLEKFVCRIEQWISRALMSKNHF